MFTGMERCWADGGEIKGAVCELLEKGLWKAWGAQ